ncbi:MAG TPA: hypothetical protein ENK88_00565 [Campylobacterales bacterium]|nr:hypothetical protein [Campylobacterales bacterium]
MYLKIIVFGTMVMLLSACGGDSKGKSVNNAPTVNAGADKTVQVNEVIIITGVANDSDGSIVDFEWRDGDKFLTNTAILNYRPTVLGNHTLTLTVTDDDGEISSDDVVITVIEDRLDYTFSDGLVAYYKFDGNSNDSSGNNTDIVMNNSIYYLNGRVNKGIGSTDKLGANQIKILNPFINQEITISFWSNPRVDHNKIYGDSSISVWNSSDQTQKSFVFAMACGNNGNGAYAEYPKLVVNDDIDNAGNDDSFYYGKNKLKEQQWQHILLQYKNGFINVFVDGEKIIERKRTVISPFGKTLNITLRGEDKIDELKIYSRVLDESEIQKLSLQY